MLVAETNVGVTTVILPVIWLVNDTIDELPMSNRWPVMVMVPVVMVVEEMFSNSGLLA